MSRVARTVGAYVELSRLSNAPTCVSNVLVGCAIGATATAEGVVPWRTATLISGAVVLLYVAGMALNDVVDRRVDRETRPGRPIPSGRVSVAGAVAFTVIMMVLGLGLAGLAHPRALAGAVPLVVVIVLYDVLHRVTPLAVVLMGCCRGLVYVTAAVAVAWPLDGTMLAVFAGALTLYVILMTVIARVETESRIGARRWLSLALPLVVIAPIVALQLPLSRWTLASAALTTLWLLLAARFVLMPPARVQRAVLAWLAGISLVDWLYLTALDQRSMAIIAFLCFAVTVIGHRRILGT